jgi:ribulose-phosphate 3-epimerase
MFKLAPSILSANFVKLEEEIKKIETDHVAYIHVDVMDGQFVPNITIGAPVVKSIKKIAKKPIDVHLMIEKPEYLVDSFIEAGSDVVTIHLEATRHPERLLNYIKSKGVKAGISINPATGLEGLEYLYGSFDLILIMTVNPGFGGQKLIKPTLEKVRKIKKEKEKRALDFIIEVDGGVNKDNIKKYIDAGAELVVAGNAVFAKGEPSKNIEELIKKGS